MATAPRIVTDYVWPPTPLPGFWRAFDDRLGADTSPTGTGKTEQEAIDDLMAQLEDNQ